MTSFKQAVENTKSNEISRTVNDMKAFATTDSSLLDLFSKIGSSRTVPQLLISSFNSALAEDKNLAIRILLWARDIRGGAGERNIFRTLVKELEKQDPLTASKLFPKIAELGRADDLFAFQNPGVRKEALAFFAKELDKGNQLFFKWAPREKSARKKDAKDLMKIMRMSAKEYRKFLSKNTFVVENDMCAKEFDNINFSHVPSLAASRYQNAFWKNAPQKYSDYIAELSKAPNEREPLVKVNAGAVYPYDVVKSLKKGSEVVANEQFEQLPDYVGDSKILPMVDTSGSMTKQISANLSCLDVAISLGLYLSSKTTSDFKDMFMTFSGKPSIELLKGTLSQKYRQLSTAHWQYNTNLHAAFEELLNTAKKNNVKAENMPEVLLILSDMQFDSCTAFDDSALEMIRRKYHAAGYKVPYIVFWNLSASFDNFPLKKHSENVSLVSGFSPAIMESVLSGDVQNITPWNIMMKTIMKERYDLGL